MKRRWWLILLLCACQPVGPLVPSTPTIIPTITLAPEPSFTRAPVTPGRTLEPAPTATMTPAPTDVYYDPACTFSYESRTKIACIPTPIKA